VPTTFPLPLHQEHYYVRPAHVIPPPLAAQGQKKHFTIAAAIAGMRQLAVSHWGSRSFLLAAATDSLSQPFILLLLFNVSVPTAAVMIAVGSREIVALPINWAAHLAAKGCVCMHGWIIIPSMAGEKMRGCRYIPLPRLIAVLFTSCALELASLS
jgi:hypothetical protein